MKNKNTLNIFFVLLVISLMITGFIGCTPETTSFGKVNIVLSGICTYDIFMDSIKLFSGVGAGTYVEESVLIGNHTFEAIDTCEGAPHGTDSVTTNIGIGDNWVNLNPTPKN